MHPTGSICCPRYLDDRTPRNIPFGYLDPVREDDVPVPVPVLTGEFAACIL